MTEIMFTLLQLLVVEGQVILVPVKDVIVENLAECWKLAEEFNATSHGSGYISACLPIVSEGTGV